MATLNLPTSPRTRVFRKIDTILRNDPLLSPVISGGSFLSWQGNACDDASFATSMAPAMRITPMNGPEVWKYPDSFVGWLFINCEILVSGYDYDDVFDLWWAVEKALYPSDLPTKLALIKSLQDVGAETGLAEFSQPAFDPKPESNYLHCAGQIKIAVLLNLNW
jgi:hypothetical protein